MTDGTKLMPDKKDKKNDDGTVAVLQTDFGNIKVEDDVIASIASLAVTSTDGVAGMVGTMADGITGILGKKNNVKGIKIDIENEDISVGVSILARYGMAIPDLAHRVQYNVYNQVKLMTGIHLKEVDVYVAGVKFLDSPIPVGETKGGQL